VKPRDPERESSSLTGRTAETRRRAVRRSICTRSLAGLPSGATTSRCSSPVGEAPRRPIGWMGWRSSAPEAGTRFRFMRAGPFGVRTGNASISSSRTSTSRRCSRRAGATRPSPFSFPICSERQRFARPGLRWLVPSGWRSAGCCLPTSTCRYRRSRGARRKISSGGASRPTRFGWSIPVWIIGFTARTPRWHDFSSQRSRTWGG
jgi:hypothetical protein